MSEGAAKASLDYKEFKQDYKDLKKYQKSLQKVQIRTFLNLLKNLKKPGCNSIPQHHVAADFVDKCHALPEPAWKLQYTCDSEGPFDQASFTSTQNFDSYDGLVHRAGSGPPPN